MNLPQHIIDQVLILYRDDLPIKQIAFMMNLSEETVQKIIDLDQGQTKHRQAPQGSS